MGKCNQNKCCYYEEGSGCPFCSECGAKPNIIDENCETCWTCKADEGKLRDENDVIEIYITPEALKEELIKQRN